VDSEYEVAWVDGVLGAAPRGSKVIPLLPRGRDTELPHKAALVGTLKLSDFKQTLTTAGVPVRPTRAPSGFRISATLYPRSSNPYGKTISPEDIHGFDTDRVSFNKHIADWLRKCKHVNYFVYTIERVFPYGDGKGCES
jgi:hypothetical protein